MSEPIRLGDLPVGTAFSTEDPILFLERATRIIIGPRRDGEFVEVFDGDGVRGQSFPGRADLPVTPLTAAECAAWLAECEAARNDAQDRLYAAQQDYADTQTPVYNARRGLRAAIPSLDAFAIAQAVHADQRVKLAAVGAAQLAAIGADQALLLAEYALRLAREREAEHER